MQGAWGIMAAMDLLLLGHITSVVLIDYFAVIVGVVMGALFAAKRNLDVIGSVAMALLTGFGGGVIRDTLLHDQGFFFMEHPLLVVCCAVVAALVFFGAHRMQQLQYKEDRKPGRFRRRQDQRADRHHRPRRSAENAGRGR